MRRAGVLLGALGALGVALAATGLGDYLNDALFTRPAQRLRLRLGLAPEADPRLRVIVVDDQTIQEYGREPTFPEWTAVAARLEAEGVRTVALHAFPNLAADVDAPPTVTPRRARFLSGAARYGSAGNPRAIPAAQVPAGLLLAVEPGTEPPPLEEARFVLGPDGALRPFLDALGSLNRGGGDDTPYGFRISETSVLPALALAALDGLAVKDGRFVTAAGPVPRSVDGALHADFLAPAELAKVSIPARALLKAPSAAVKKALRGAEIALLVPDGYTGASAFVPTPSGLMPSYVVTASLVSGALKGRYLVKPVAEAWVLLALAGVCAAAFGLLPAALAAHAGLWLLTLLVFAGAAALDRAGWILPVAPAALVVITGLGMQQTWRLLDLWRKEIATQKDLELGRAVQSLLVPQSLSGRVGPWEFSVAYEPYGPMSGDWVQIYRAPEGTKGVLALIAIGDVVGKGPSAALNTAAIASAWSAHAARWDAGELALESFLRALNGVIHKTFAGEQMSTLSLAVLREDGITLVNCGAPAWLHVAAGGRVQAVRLPTVNPIGIVDDLPKLATVELAPQDGDVLLAYTDGVMDGVPARRTFARNIAAAGLPDGDVFGYLAREARAAGKGNVLPDDFTLLMLRRAPAARSASRDTSAAAC